jgi:hypothetical protein
MTYEPTSQPWLVNFQVTLSCVSPPAVAGANEKKNGPVVPHWASWTAARLWNEMVEL